MVIMKTKKEAFPIPWHDIFNRCKGDSWDTLEEKCAQEKRVNERLDRKELYKKIEDKTLALQDATYFGDTTIAMVSCIDLIYQTAVLYKEMKIISSVEQ